MVTADIASAVVAGMQAAAVADTADTAAAVTDTVAAAVGCDSFLQFCFVLWLPACGDLVLGRIGLA